MPWYCSYFVVTGVAVFFIACWCWNHWPKDRHDWDLVGFYTLAMIMWPALLVAGIVMLVWLILMVRNDPDFLR